MTSPSSAPDPVPALGDRAGVRVGALLAVLLLAAFDLCWRLGSSDFHFDEVLYARDGWHAIHAQQPFSDHPLFGKYLIGLGELVVGRNAVGVRIVPVLCSWAATIVVFCFARRLAGWWTGVLAAGLWAALPRALVVAGEVTGHVRLDRYGLLDTMGNAFGMALLYAGWRWAEHPTWRRALLTGLLVGVTVSTKLNGALLAFPVVALGAVVVRPARRLLAHVGAMAAVAVAFFAATYLPFGTAGPHMVSTMIDVQRTHAKIGHQTAVAGYLWYREPWWANLAFWRGSQGIAVVLALAVGAAAACWHRQRIGVLYLLVTTVLLLVTMAATPVALAHYWVAWLGPLLMLVALGLGEMLRRRREVAAVAVLILVLLGAVSIRATTQVATLPSGDYRSMAAAIHAAGGRPKTALVLGTDVTGYFPGVSSTFGSFAAFVPADVPIDLVVIERQFAVITSPADLATLRDRAKGSGLTPHTIGDIEYWTAPT